MVEVFGTTSPIPTLRGVRSLAVALAVMAVGCGGDGGSLPTAKEVEAAVEKAGGIGLRSVEPPIPEIAAAFTGSDGERFVTVYVLKNPADARTVEKSVPPPTTTAVKTLAHGNVFVVVTGPKADAVLQAVREL